MVVVPDLNIILVLIAQLSNENDVLFNNTVIDKTSLDIINGSIIDFKVEMIGESFVINNPKASSSCGCGLSFSV